MKIVSARLHKYELPLTKPLRLKDQTITKREGLIVTLTDESGNQGQGEIAPLPGFSPESLHEATAYAQVVITGLVSTRDAIDWKIPPDSIKRHDYGSVKFGFESALLMLESTGQKTLVNKYINDAARKEVAINGLVIDAESAETEVAKLLKAGFQSIKLKLGRQSLADDIALVNKLHSLVNGNATLRLDVNRQWGVNVTLAFIKETNSSVVEYLEEPVGSTDELRQLCDEKVKVALDESLLELTTNEIKEFLSNGSVAALVLKPTMLGLSRSLELASLAESFGVSAVISSSFESALGLTMLANLASAVNKTDVPAGLDTCRHFKCNLINLPINDSGTRVDLKSSSASLVDLDLLKEIATG